jgi:hypothetical protein
MLYNLPPLSYLKPCFPHPPLRLQSILLLTAAQQLGKKREVAEQGSNVGLDEKMPGFGEIKTIS